MLYRKHNTLRQYIFFFLAVISCWYFFFASTYSLRPFQQLFWVLIASLSILIGVLHRYKLDVVDQIFFISMFILFCFSIFSVNILGSMLVVGQYFIYYTVARMITGNCESRTIHNIIFSFAIFHLICLYIQVLAPSVYKLIIMPLLPSSTHTMITQQMEWNKAYYGFAIQSSMSAMYLSIGTILSALRFKDCKNKISKILYLLLTFLFLIAVFFTQRRGSAGACIVILVLIYMTAKGNKLSKVVFGVSVVVMIGIIGISNIPGVSAMLGKVQLSLSNGSFMNGRDSNFLRGFQAIGERPIFGYGGGQVSAATGYAWIENSYISIMIQWGILGAIAFFAPYITMVKNIFMLRVNLRNETIYMEFSKYMLFLYVVMSFVENYFGDALNVFILYVCVFSGIHYSEVLDEMIEIDKAGIK